MIGLPSARDQLEKIGILLDGALDFLVQPDPHIGIQLGVDIDRRDFDADGRRAGAQRRADASREKARFFIVSSDCS